MNGLIDEKLIIKILFVSVIGIKVFMSPRQMVPPQILKINCLQLTNQNCPFCYTRLFVCLLTYHDVL